jgi:hypothetical protein
VGVPLRPIPLRDTTVTLFEEELGLGLGRGASGKT